MTEQQEQLKQDMQEIARQRSPLKKSAFLIEALILFTVLIAAIAIFTSLFAASVQRSVEGHDLEQAVTLASNIAEEFAANPAAVPDPPALEGLDYLYDVTSENMVGGTLYSARIVITKTSTGEQVYALDTQRYVRGVS